jgi:adenine C2-methylase RlmN of 23S rRNA A2503 and tRNA A37
VEVKIGVADSHRELTVSTADSPDQVEALVTEAMRNTQGMLSLVDDKGRRFMVPTARVAYVEIGPADSRRVGFAVGG